MSKNEMLTAGTVSTSNDEIIEIDDDVEIITETHQNVKFQEQENENICSKRKFESKYNVNLSEIDTTSLEKYFKNNKNRNCSYEDVEFLLLQKNYHITFHNKINCTQKKERYLFEPFIPSRSVVLFDGLGESGKSLFILQMLLCISNQQKFLSLDVKQNYNVMYISAEDSENEIDERLQKIVKALKIEKVNNFFWQSVINEKFYFNTYALMSSQNETSLFFNSLCKAIKTLQIKLVVFDSLINFYNLNENDTSHARCFFEIMKRVCVEYDCSILFLHHQTKETMRGNENGIFRGSGVFREQSRCRFTIQKYTDDVKRIHIEKLNYYTKHKREYYVKLATINENYENCLAFFEVPKPEKTKKKEEKTKKKKEDILDEQDIF